MNLYMMMAVTEMVEKCPCCGDATIGNGSKFIVEETTFERTCRECGWEIKGKVEGESVIVTSDNRDEIKAKLKPVNNGWINMNGEFVESPYLDLDGNMIKRTPISNPYNYDEYVLWKDETFDHEKHSGVYSDRLYQWNYEKFNRCCNEVFGNQGQYFDNRKPCDIEKFLSLYFDKEVKLLAIVQGCNQSSGYPYWIFFYEDKEVAND